jgi:hydrogenase maturation protein HypF
MTAPVLVVGVGNPSRGDDALGPLCISALAERLAGALLAGELELLTDFQLQVEHAMDLTGRQRVFFVDASLRAKPPFELTRVAPDGAQSAFSHAMSPQAVLEAHRRTVGEPPESWLLEIRGERFELGESLSAAASEHLEAALSCLAARLRGGPNEEREGRRHRLEGTVQGVGLRPWACRRARALGLTGRVRNTRRGLELDAFGTSCALDALLSALQRELPPCAQVRTLAVSPLEEVPPADFRIESSDDQGDTKLSVPADLAPCAACARELRDPEDRHHRYVFTSCTECGPRFAYARQAPYDRATTALLPFAPCRDCAREVGDPDDRRFHAQTAACPRCGPRLVLTSASGDALDVGDVIDAAVARLALGDILAVQGPSGVHLVCDATRDDVVRKLRSRKARDHKPLAVLARDVTMARELAVLEPEAEAALSSLCRPIVLADRLASRLAPSVCAGSRRVGVLLPSNLLQQRLADGAARPLVMTSANLSGQPVALTREEALHALSGIADAFVLHDLAPVRRVEDSVLDVSARGVRVLRRARGLAPVPIRLRMSAPEPVLAVGGELKHSACVVLGDEAFLTPHLGDLSSVEAERVLARELESFERLLGVAPQVVVHDLHPDYATTRYALARKARRHVGVQHHVAHALSVIAEHGLDEPVVAVVYDGSGFGTDGTAWGGEILLVDGARFQRLSALRPLPLAGGERAIRQVFRQAFAALVECSGRDALELSSRLALFEGQSRAALQVLLRMLETGTEVVRARGLGRFFDAVGALVCGVPTAGFEGHVPSLLEDLACGVSEAAYPVRLPEALAAQGPLSPSHELDLRPALQSVIDDCLHRVAPSTIAARFHQTVIEATGLVVDWALEETGARRVVLGGGAFQNRLLEQGVVRWLGADRVCTARSVPMNDGGLALGQALYGVLSTSEPDVRAR